MNKWLRRFTGKAEQDTPLRSIVAHFNEAANDDEHFPSHIDPRIYHVRLLLEHLGDLNGKSALDVGSGKGRFARIVREENPGSRICAFDLAQAMLRSVPEEVQRCAGSMTALPFADRSFNAAYAIESLEHAVDIETAVSEMCRVVKPGGKLFIIDKNAEHWGRLETPQWERWFDRRGLEKLLLLHCCEVSSRPVSYWEDVAPDGLFLAWLAVK